MPRIPFQLAGGGIPSNIPTDRASPGLWAAPGVAINRMAGEIEQTSDKLQEAERRVQATRDRVFASQLLSALDIHMEDLRDNADPNLSGKDAEQWFVESSQTFLKDHLGGTTDENLRGEIQSVANSRIAHGAIQTRRTVNAKSIARTESQALEQVRELAKLGTPETLHEALSLIGDMTSAGVFSPSQGVQAKEYARTHSTGNAAATLTSVDPYAAADVIAGGQGIFASMSPAELEQAANHARKEGDRLQIQSEQYQATIHAEALNEVKMLEKQQERRWGQNEVEILAHFLDNPTTDPRVIITAARQGLIKPDFTDVNRLMGALKDIRAQANDKDDPDTLMDVDRRVYDARGPQIGSRELTGLRQSHLISDVTYRRSLQVIKSDADLRRGESDKAQTEQTQIRMGAYNNGKQVIDDWFTTVGVISGDDKNRILALKGQALNQFWDLTKGGRLSGADPTEVLPYVMQQFRSVGSGVARTLLDEVPQKYRDPKKLQKAYQSGEVKASDYKRWSTYMVNANDIVPMAEWETMHLPVPYQPPPTVPAPAAQTPAPGGRRAPKP